MSNTSSSIPENNQKVFDSTYITASEIMRQLGISRAAFLYGRRVHKLPEAIVVNEGRLLVWKRQEVETPLQVWKIAIDNRKAA